MKILVAGDFCPQYRVSDRFENRDFEYVLGAVKDIISEANYSIVNFECPILNGGEKPIAKCGPNLQCSEKGVEAVKWAGFDCVTLANNHFLDYGNEGVENLLEVCSKHCVDTVGGGRSLYEASKILYQKINGSTLAVVNCCEHEFSIATETTAGSNPLNPIQQFYAIKKAKNKADYVLVIVHGGHEYYQLPSPRMQETYRFFIDAGADAVVNHHQHCYSGYEIYKKKPIFYGLGNFCFDKLGKTNETWHEGFLVVFDFTKESVSYNMYPYIQCAEDAKIAMAPRDCFDKTIEELNDIINNEDKLRRALDAYYGKSFRDLNSIFEPCRNKFILGAQRRGWFPSFLSPKHKLRINNYIMCESHRDKLAWFFNNNRS